MGSVVLRLFPRRTGLVSGEGVINSSILDSLQGSNHALDHYFSGAELRSSCYSSIEEAILSEVRRLKDRPVVTSRSQSPYLQLPRVFLARSMNHGLLNWLSNTRFLDHLPLKGLSLFSRPRLNWFTRIINCKFIVLSK